ncbi:MAG: hypothetical protein HOY69_40590, partial [Streptomyces sp.]|nr:hypothetical protein [Streptomyces sp.]
MRTPDEVFRVPWHELTHAYGPAQDMPEHIGALYFGDEEAAGEALFELYGSLQNQGEVFDAAPPAVPFLAHAALHAPGGRRAELLMLLTALADHHPDDPAAPQWPGSAAAGVCEELARELPWLLPCLHDT